MRVYKNYRECNRVKLYNGDCLDLLKSLPDESVDLVVTSPPYCMGKAYEDTHDDIETFKEQHISIFNVFGDGLNDVEMFQVADESYAVANAVPELKQLATNIINGNDEDGVAKWLEENAFD